ncbi:MAG: BamA/TamA family outer membrane protein [Limnochordaceae bacterium]|nr:BamA/TamA family outer membrane protein [Limnochordaceae bacterium]
MTEWVLLIRRRRDSCRQRGTKAVLVALAVAVLGSVVVGAGIGPAAAATSDNAGSRVVRIAVEGNRQIPAEEILAAIKQTKVGEPLDEGKLQADLQAVADLGWFDPASLLAQWDRSTQDDQGVDLTIVVHEYPVIQRVEIKGLTYISPDVVRGYLRAKEGRVYNQREVQEDVWSLPNKLLNDKGMGVLPTEPPSFDPESAVLTIALAEVRIGKILVEGNQKTKAYVILREFPVREGDPLDLRKLSQGLNRLRLLGFFDEYETKVELIDTDDPLVVDVKVTVKELKTGQASFGAGYSTGGGLMGLVEVADNNFLGRGESVKLRLQVGKADSSYEASFYEPYLDSQGTSLDVQLYNTKTSQRLNGKPDVYEERRTGGSLTVGRPVTQFTRATAGLKIENVKNIPGADSEVSVPNSGASHVLTLGLLTDTTNSLSFPTQGYRNSLSLAFGGGLLKGNWSFTKYQDELSLYKKAGSSNQVFALRSAVGYAQGNVPAQEIFRVGGADTVRGYGYGDFTGNQMFLVNTEYRFPITQQLGGVVFADSGYAWQAGQAVRLQDLKTGLGVGIRLNTPIGLFRLDYGVGQGVGRAYFGIGQVF